VNVADDTERHGLLVCPDLDTIFYTLAGLADREQGWGVAGDTFTALGMLERLGEETWFRIGDADLAVHVRRNHLLKRGLSLTDAVAEMAGALGVGSRLLPATDDRLRTRVATDEGELGFSYVAADLVLYAYLEGRRRPEEIAGAGIDAGTVELVLDRVRRYAFKRRLPWIPKLTTRTVGHDFLHPRAWRGPA